jgi:hypothetical protein
MTAAAQAALYDAYIASVKAPFLRLPDTDDNWRAMLAAVAAARAAWGRRSA